MKVIYDIPRTVEYDPAFKLIKSYDKVGQGGDVDYGPHYWIDHAVEFTERFGKAVLALTAPTVAKLIGDYLAYNYQDNFRQTEIRSGPLVNDDHIEWVVRVHLAWGDRPYYTPVTP